MNEDYHIPTGPFRVSRGVVYWALINMGTRLYRAVWFSKCLGRKSVEVAEVCKEIRGVLAETGPKGRAWAISNLRLAIQTARKVER